MKLFFPVFGYGDCPHVCKKWVIQAENADIAFELATKYFDRLSPLTRVYYSPFPDRWVGPIFTVEEARNHNGIIFLN